jgi:ADP-ribose pyrophosphatase YjhB (NUDIX family)
LSQRPGVGCGAAILRNGRILLVERRTAPEAGHWNLPGGKVDFLEPVEAAIVREIHEEVGLDIALGPLLCVTQMIGIDGQHWVSPIHSAVIVAGEPINREPDKIGAIGWFVLDAPPSPLAQGATDAIRALLVSSKSPEAAPKPAAGTAEP